MKTSIGFVATIAHKNGKGVSFLGRDDHSGGYPMLWHIPKIRSSISEAVKDRDVLKGMTTYYGADKHDFSKTAVCEVVLNEISGSDVEKAYEAAVLEKVRKTLNTQELEALKRVL